ncbi:hypothetical protein ACHAWT_005997 [Skeletonema menzelii]
MISKDLSVVFFYRTKPDTATKPPLVLESSSLCNLNAQSSWSIIGRNIFDSIRVKVLVSSTIFPYSFSISWTILDSFAFCDSDRPKPPFPSESSLNTLRRVKKCRSNSVDRRKNVANLFRKSSGNESANCCTSASVCESAAIFFVSASNSGRPIFSSGSACFNTGALQNPLDFPVVLDFNSESVLARMSLARNCAYLRFFSASFFDAESSRVPPNFPRYASILERWSSAYPLPDPSSTASSPVHLAKSAFPSSASANPIKRRISRSIPPFTLASSSTVLLPSLQPSTTLLAATTDKSTPAVDSFG